MKNRTQVFGDKQIAKCNSTSCIFSPSAQGCALNKKWCIFNPFPQSKNSFLKRSKLKTASRADRCEPWIHNDKTEWQLWQPLKSRWAYHSFREPRSEGLQVLVPTAPSGWHLQRELDSSSATPRIWLQPPQLIQVFSCLDPQKPLC